MKLLNASLAAAGLFLVVGVVSFTQSDRVTDLLWAAIGLACLAAATVVRNSSKQRSWTPNARELGVAAGLVSVILSVALTVTTHTAYPLLGGLLGAVLLAGSVFARGRH
jgi:1,4-dihydroxy-2-naphthoate octaprenyltransferase